MKKLKSWTMCLESDFLIAPNRRKIEKKRNNDNFIVKIEVKFHINTATGSGVTQCFHGGRFKTPPSKFCPPKTLVSYQYNCATTKKATLKCAALKAELLE